MKICKHIIFTFALTTLVLLAACIDENGIMEVVGPSDDNKVTIEIFTRAQNYQLPETRAGANENDIEKTPYLLVFEVNGGSNKCIEIVQAVEHTGTVKRYVQLTKRETGTYQFLILANNEVPFYYGGSGPYTWSVDNLETYLLQQELSDISNKLLTGKIGTSDHLNPPYVNDWQPLLPMSCLTGTVNGINVNTKIGTTGDPLELIRGVSVITFYNNPEMNGSTPLNNFVLKGVASIVNTPQQGKVYNTTFAPPDNVGLTDIVSPDENNLIYKALLITDDWANGHQQATWSFPCYVYETAESQDSYFILKGSLTADYGNGIPEPRDFFYKMAPLDNYDNILAFKRNHRYAFEIKNVRSPGYATVQEAMAAPPSNRTIIEYIVDETDLSSHHIITNGHYYLGVSNSRYIAYTDIADDDYHAFSLVTNYFSKYNGVATTNKITAYGGITCNVSSVPEGTNATDPLEVKVNFKNSDAGWVVIWLGDLILTVNVKREDIIIPVGGTRLSYYKYDTNEGKWIYDYYLISGTVNSADKDWIKLVPGIETPPSGGSGLVPPDPAPITNVTDVVTSGHGKIQVQVDQNTTAAVKEGIFYLSTGVNPDPAINQSEVERIKFYIKQAAN